MIVPIVNGVAPDGQPFEAGVALDSRYSAEHSTWLRALIESGGATDTTPPPTPAPVVDRPRRRGPAVVDATATFARDQEVQG